MQAIHNGDCDETEELTEISQIIIMYIHHALINALSAHIIHINLKYDILYTCRVYYNPTKTIYIKYFIFLKKKKSERYP